MQPNDLTVRHVSATGLRIFKNIEGLGPRDHAGHYTNMRIVNGKETWFPYHGAADAPGVMTVGYGHVCSAGELSFYKVNGVTEAEASTLLSKDLAARFEPIVNRHAIHIADQAGFDALVSLAYNDGAAPFGPTHSMGQALASGDDKKIAAAFLEYICSGEPLKPQDGLIRRRLIEAHYYFTGTLIYANNAAEAVKLLDHLIAEGVLNSTARYNQIRHAA